MNLTPSKINLLQEIIASYENIDTTTEGNYLTQAALTNENERVFSHKIYLAVNNSPESWMEVTPDYKAQWEDEHKEEPESDESQR